MADHSDDPFLEAIARQQKTPEPRSMPRRACCAWHVASDVVLLTAALDLFLGVFLVVVRNTLYFRGLDISTLRVDDATAQSYEQLQLILTVTFWMLPALMVLWILILMFTPTPPFRRE